MELNYEKKYAYAELESILNWLGEEYTSKIPNKILRTIKQEKKFAYRPELDFSKPLESQVRQETKNMIAYLTCTYWLKDENEKAQIQEAIKENQRKIKEQKRLERQKEIEMKAKIAGKNTVTGSIDQALKETLKKEE